MSNIKSEFKKKFPKIKFDESLKKHSTMKVGGPADFFYTLTKTEDLAPLIKLVKKHRLPFFIIGRGSNILFHDDGFRGLIIKNETKKIIINDPHITADSGVLISALIHESLSHNLSGFEKWVGLPGTVGGAVSGNAGCNGLETKDILICATLLCPRSGKTHEVSLKYFDFKYRYSKLKKSPRILLSATFKLKPSSLSPLKQRQLMSETTQSRSDAQPHDPSTGSFFKNPSPKKPAGFLLDKAGLKGKTIGGAQISTKHANFFINTKNATSADIRALARLAKCEVKAKFGILLHEEVQILSTTGKAKL